MFEPWILANEKTSNWRQIGWNIECDNGHRWFRRVIWGSIDTSVVIGHRWTYKCVTLLVFTWSYAEFSWEKFTCQLSKEKRFRIVMLDGLCHARFVLYALKNMIRNVFIFWIQVWSGIESKLLITQEEEEIILIRSVNVLFSTASLLCWGLFLRNLNWCLEEVPNLWLPFPAKLG